MPQLLSFLSIIISWNNIQFEFSRSDSYSDRCQVREEIKSHSTPSSHQLGETSFWKNQCRIWPSASADLKLKLYEAAIINSREKSVVAYIIYYICIQYTFKRFICIYNTNTNILFMLIMRKRKHIFSQESLAWVLLINIKIFRLFFLCSPELYYFNTRNVLRSKIPVSVSNFSSRVKVTTSEGVVQIFPFMKL